MTQTGEVRLGDDKTSAGTAVAGWVAEKFIGAVGGKVGGLAFEYALKMVGLSDDSQEMKNKLDQIQKGISEILEDLKVVQQQLDALTAQLSLSTKEILNAIGENTILTARAAIDTHYGTGSAVLTAGGPAQATSLTEAIRLRRAGQEVDTRAFATNVISTWDIQKSVETIAAIAGSSTTFTAKPLIQGWSDYLIEKNRGQMYKDQRALTVYLTLESYFQQLLEPQFKGIALIASAKSFDASDEAQAHVRTAAFLADIAPKILAQADLFVKCADEIVMSLYTDTRWFYSPSPTQVADFNVTIALRASLMRAVVRAALGKQESVAGIYGTVYGRQVEKDTEAQRTLTPAGYAASAGTPIAKLAVGGAAPIEWALVTENQYARLRPKEESAFWSFRYYWPWKSPAPEVGRAIDPSFDGGLKPYWVDLDTFEKTDKAGDRTALIADFADARFLRGCVFPDPSAADKAVVSTPADGTTGGNDNRKAERSDETRGAHPARATDVVMHNLAKGTLTGTMWYRNPQGPVEGCGYELEFPLFRYKGKSAKVTMVIGRVIALELLENVWKYGRDGYAYMHVAPRVVISLRRKRGDEAPAMETMYDTNPNGSLWDKESGGRWDDQGLIQYTTTLVENTKSDDTYSLVLSFSIANEVHVGSSSTRPDGPARARLKYDLNTFRMTWQ